MKRKKDTRSNYSIITVAVFSTAVICLLLSAFIEAREVAGVLKSVGIVFLCVIIIQGLVLSINPELFKNKKKK